MAPSQSGNKEIPSHRAKNGQVKNGLKVIVDTPVVYMKKQLDLFLLVESKVESQSLER